MVRTEVKFIQPKTTQPSTKKWNYITIVVFGGTITSHRQ